MSLFNIDTSVFENWITAFQKNVTYVPRTQVINNYSGQESFVDGTSVTIQGVFFRRTDVYNQDIQALFGEADAILIVRTTQTLNKNDKIIFDGRSFIVDNSIFTRYLGSTALYKTAQLFMSNDGVVDVVVTGNRLLLNSGDLFLLNSNGFLFLEGNN